MEKHSLSARQYCDANAELLLLATMVTNDLNGNPFQLGFVRPAQMMMFAKIICDPPLGQATVVPNHQQAVHYLTVFSLFSLL